MSYQFKHYEKGSTQGSGSYVFRKYSEPSSVVPTSAQYFTFNDNVVTGYVGNDTDIIVPRSYSIDAVTGDFIDGNDHQVDTLGTDCFRGKSSLRSITLQDNITTIGVGAMNGCSQLRSIFIPSSVTSIATTSFSYCPSVSSIVVDSNNTTYDSRNNCNAIIETATNKLIAGCYNTTIPNNVTSIGDYAFGGCTFLSNITIPSSVTTIGASAFRECSTNLTSINISNVTSLGAYAFYQCYKLETVTLSNDLTIIDDYTFTECSKLSTINIPSSLKNINKYAFAACTSLSGIIDLTNSSFEAIGSSAFYGCTGLGSVAIGKNVTYIGANAFGNCTGLTGAYLYNTSSSYKVSSVSRAWFYGCSSLLILYIRKTINPATTFGSKWNYYSANGTLTVSKVLTV